MRLRKKLVAGIGYLFISLFAAGIARAQLSPSSENVLKGVISDSSLLAMNEYSPVPAPALRLLFDYYHHQKPATPIGDISMVTGGWVNNFGRYGWDDFVHTNTLDPVFFALEKEYAIRMMEQPFSDAVLAQTDAVIIINPDDPRVNPAAKTINDEEIAALLRFVRKGGSLMVTINAGGVPSETFEEPRLRELMRNFGLDWNNDNTHASDLVLGNQAPYFYDIPVFHYGGGCTLNILQDAEKPEVLLNVRSDSGYPDSNVKGAGIVMVRYGKGKVILVGDTGSWTGNMSRPWAENERLLKQLFRYLKPDNGVVPPQLKVGQSLKYAVEETSLQMIPLDNTLSKIKQPHYKDFFPIPDTWLPYLQANAGITLSVDSRTEDLASHLTASISDFRWADKKMPNAKNDKIHFTASRQGQVSAIKPQDETARWLAPDIDVLIALIPVDGVRPGDQWPVLGRLRIPTFSAATKPAPVRKIPTDLEYVGDTNVEGRECRLLRVSGSAWLDDLDVSIKDLFPESLVQSMGKLHYKFHAPHGGKLIFKREQWVDQQTGIVVKARIQTRIVAWIQDLTQPIPKNNIEKDNHMVVSLAQIANFRLK